MGYVGPRAATQLWAKVCGIDWTFIQPGKPAENAYLGRFNGTFRTEALDQHACTDLEKSQRIADEWLVCRPPNLRRWCTNRNWHATVSTTGASSTDGVGSWAAHVGHRIQHIARELRFDRSPTGCPGSKTIAEDRLILEAGVLDSRLLMVA